MAEPAKQPATDAPLVDPHAIERAYRIQRARRRALEQRKRSQRAANVRFWIVVCLLLAGSVYLMIAMWHQVQRVFGL
jgi:hypothetical protein